MRTGEGVSFAGRNSIHRLWCQYWRGGPGASPATPRPGHFTGDYCRWCSRYRLSEGQASRAVGNCL